MTPNSQLTNKSRRHFLKRATGSLLTAALLTCCRSLLKPPPSPTTTPQLLTALPHSPTPFPATPTTVHLDIKIGQMLMVGFRGLAVEDSHFILRDIQQHHLGGVVLFDYDIPSQQPVRNVASPTQLQTLIASLQSTAAIPLLVAIDHEGGIVTRLKEQHGFPPTLSHQQLGELADLPTTYDQAAQMAATLATLGVNLNLAPVVDLCVNPDNPIIAQYERCFSADPQVVTEHARQFIQAHHEQGILCTVKHFPGHGSSTEDSHEGWVDVTACWSRQELEPYAHIIEAGLADAVMTAHVFNANLDPQHPATLSAATLDAILRQELGFDGVVISDDMQMGALSDHYTFEEAIRLALEAGVDILAFANNSVYEEDVVPRAIAAIKEHLRANRISEERIDQSYQRIQKLKGRLTT